MRQAKIMQEGANVLQQVDVSDIFTSLALGIAEAQERLDDNSIKQILRLTDKQVAGKSLIELGFVPAFYHFDYADISASIQLKMAVKTSMDLGIKARVEFARSRGYDESFLELLNESRQEKKRTEFKSSRTFLINSNSSERIDYQNRTIQMDQSSGSIEKVEMMKDEMRNSEKIDRVEVDVIDREEMRSSSESSEVVVTKRDGYGMIYIPNRKAKTALLKVHQYPEGEQVHQIGEQINYKIKTSFQATLEGLKALAANGGLGTDAKVVGCKRSVANDTVGGFSVFFGHDKDRVNENFSDNDVNNDGVFDQINALADILLKDSSINVEIVGYTDSTGKEAYNQGLGKRRAERVKDHLVARGVPSARVRTKSMGEIPAREKNGDGQHDENYRRVDVLLPHTADFFHIQGSNVNKGGVVEPEFSSESKYGIISVMSKIPATDKNVSFEYGNRSFEANAKSAEDFLQKETSIQGFDETFSSEVHNEVVYLLSHSAKLQFTSYSNESEDISIQSSRSEVGTESGTENTLLVDETVNSSSRLRNDAGASEEESTFAVGASVDFRMSRQFEMEVTGNSSMSARLSSVPPPDAFTEHIRKTLNGEA